MQKNMAMWERCMRVVFGLGVLSLLFWGPKKLWALLGLIPLSTGISGWCPLYSVIGISTKRSDKPVDEKQETPIESLG